MLALIFGCLIGLAVIGLYECFLWLQRQTDKPATIRTVYFAPRFCGAIAARTKTQTIRRRLVDYRPGDILVLRALDDARLLGVEVCRAVDYVRIYIDGSVAVNGKMQNTIDLSEAEGFDSVADFISFFTTTYGLPFEGQMIRW